MGHEGIKCITAIRIVAWKCSLLYFWRRLVHLLLLSVGVVFNDVDEVRRILRCCRLELGADDFPHIDHTVVEAVGDTLANLLIGGILGVVALTSVIHFGWSQFLFGRAVISVVRILHHHSLHFLSKLVFLFIILIRVPLLHRRPILRKEVAILGFVPSVAAFRLSTSMVVIVIATARFCPNVVAHGGREGAVRGWL